MREKLFLNSSRHASDQLTRLFDFAWPTASAMWNLRWQVKGYVSVNPTVTIEELAGRFTAGSGIQGANLKRACIDNEWNEQLSQFSRMLLIEICALYEAWCEDSLNELKLPKKYGKEIQFPSTPNSKDPKNGIGNILAQVKSKTNTSLTLDLYPALCTSAKHKVNNIESLLICYRYFKELRNSAVHAANIVSDKLRDAEQAYSKLTAQDLGAKEVPLYIPLSADSTAKLAIRGIVGFGDIVLKIICSLDAEFTCSANAETLFLRLWKEKHGSRTITKANSNDRKERIIRMIKKLELPALQNVENIQKLLIQKGLIY